MNGAELRAELERQGLSQSGFARLVSDLSGERLPLRTVQGWAIGEARIPPLVPAILALLDEQEKE